MFTLYSICSMPCWINKSNLVCAHKGCSLVSVIWICSLGTPDLPSPRETHSRAGPWDHVAAVGGRRWLRDQNPAWTLLRGRWFGFFFPPFSFIMPLAYFLYLLVCFWKQSTATGYRANVTLLAVKVTLIELRCPSHSVAPKGFNAGWWDLVHQEWV